jgi:hypothetical protein
LDVACVAGAAFLWRPWCLGLGLVGASEVDGERSTGTGAVEDAALLLPGLIVPKPLSLKYQIWPVLGSSEQDQRVRVAW